MKDTIKELALELKPFKSVDSVQFFFIKWFGYTLVVSLGSLYLLPIRDDINLMLNSFHFNFENFLWFSLSSLSAVVFYFSAFPQIVGSKIKFLAFFILGMLLTLMSMNFSTDLAQEFHNEMDLWKGGCGFIIFSMAIINSVFLTVWTRQAAPGNPTSTGFWAALSASSMGCLLMQVVCAHNTSAHLLVWHFIPLLITCLLGSIAAKRLLSW